MVVSASHELKGLAVSVAAAILFGIIYDFTRALRRVSGKNLLTDALCWIMICAVCGGIWLRVLGGELRWYMAIGAFSGAALYFALAGRYVFRVFLFLAELICRFFHIILKILLTPLKFLCKMIGVYIKRAKNKFFRKVEDKNDEKTACIQV